MPALHKTQDVPVGNPNGGWTLITDAAGITATTALSLYAIDGSVWIKAATANTQPTNRDAAVRFDGRFREGQIKTTLGDLFPGVTNPTHLFALGDSGGASIVVSHA